MIEFLETAIQCFEEDSKNKLGFNNRAISQEAFGNRLTGTRREAYKRNRLGVF